MRVLFAITQRRLFRAFPLRAADRSGEFDWILLVVLVICGLAASIQPAFAQSKPQTKPLVTEGGATPASPASPGPATPAVPADKFATGHILVAPTPGSSDTDFLRALNARGGNSLGRLRGLNVHVVDVPPGLEKKLVDDLSTDPQVLFAEVDQLVEPSLVTNDPSVSAEWHLSTISAAQAWDTSTGTGITIAILDTGVDGTHPDLAPHMVPGWNFYDNNSNTSDVYGHGTAVAGAAAAIVNNGIGVAGVAGNANVMPVRISDPTGYALWSTIAQGLTWAADHGARVANISYTVAGTSTVISAANYFRSKGGVVAVSAGNTGALDSTAPTNSMLVVSATDASDQLASFSSYGSVVTLAAPGASIYTTANGGGYRYASGTSFSSPIVAGAAALVLSRRPDLTPSQVDAALKSTATDLGAPGADIYFGAGRLNVAAAVQMAGSTIAADSTPPAVAIASPTGGTVSGTVAVTVNASDNVGVTRVELRVNGATVAADSSAPFQFSWDSTGIANGTAKLTAVAYDAAGNSTTSAPVSVNVSNASSIDTLPPSVAIASPSSGGVTVSGTLVVSVNATDNVAVTRVDLRVNGSTVATGNTAPYQFSWNTTATPNGAASLTAVAYDGAGNSSVSAPVSVTVSNSTDTTAPTLAITSPSNGANVSGSVYVTTSVADDSGTAGVTQQLYVDGVLKVTVTGKALSYKWNTRPLPSGTHSIKVVARDTAGNSTSQTIQVTR